MSKARDNILARLKAHAHFPHPAGDFAVIDEKQWSAEERIAHFKSTMESVHTEVHVVNRDRLGEQLKSVIETKRIGRLCYAPATELGATVAALFGEGSAPELVAYEREIEIWKEELFFNIDASVTSTLGGVVETGSLILWNSPEEPRLMSLVPPIHVAIVEASQLFNTLREAMTEQQWSEGMPTNALLISGPSKTADIEQTLAYGVHGPKELVVLVVQE